MAWKPTHWTLGLAMGFALVAAHSSAFAQNTPTLAKPPLADSDVTVAAGIDKPSAISAADAAPLAADQSSESATEEGDVNAEVIRERFTNSAVKVERHVTQDA